MYNDIENLKLAKSKYNSISTNIESAIQKLENLKLLLNDKTNFSGFDNIATIVNDVTNTLNGLKGTKTDLSNAIKDCETNIERIRNQLEAMKKEQQVDLNE